jgi:hypothetical protein
VSAIGSVATVSWYASMLAALNPEAHEALMLEGSPEVQLARQLVQAIGLRDHHAERLIG